MNKNEKESGKHRCYVCGHLCYGVLGDSYHMVRTNYETRYYCKKCMEDRLKGG